MDVETLAEVASLLLDEYEGDEESLAVLAAWVAENADAFAEGESLGESRKPGEVWQGDSGRWFTLNADGHVTPAKAPDGGGDVGGSSTGGEGGPPGKAKADHAERGKARDAKRQDVARRDADLAARKAHADIPAEAQHGYTPADAALAASSSALETAATTFGTLDAPEAREKAVEKWEKVRDRRDEAIEKASAKEDDATDAFTSALDSLNETYSDHSDRYEAALGKAQEQGGDMHDSEEESLSKESEAIDAEDAADPEPEDDDEESQT